MKPLQLTGVIPPMITPLDASRKVDAGAVTRLGTRLIDQGADGLFVLGSSGEGPLLRRQERRDVVRAAAEACRGRAPLLAGALEASTGRTIEAAQDAAELGADALVLTTPYYVLNDQAMAIRHVEAVLAATDLPVMLYNIPSATGGYRFEPETVLHLAAHPRIIGLKDSSGDLAAVQQTLRLTRHLDFAVFQGAERLCAITLTMGAHGLVPGLGNVAPALLKRLYLAARAGDLATAMHCQDQVEALWHLHAPGHWLTNLKAAVGELGYGSGLALEPIPPASPDQLHKIRRLLAEADLVPAQQP
ncbi:MAG TPA: dihydrodipicolinate synthase family protein [Symbiobacteriaceae bacterium]|nr:dihydrodipicolinate synthase family protein [Symbiobacteriaceae bacterium]